MNAASQLEAVRCYRAHGIEETTVKRRTLAGEVALRMLAASEGFGQYTRGPGIARTVEMWNVVRRLTNLWF